MGRIYEWSEHADRPLDSCGHLILAARAEGLERCWIGSFRNEELEKVLQIPQEWNIVAVTPLSFPKEPCFKSKAPKPLEEIVFFNSFSTS
ncbi:nitroreductase family protein [Candidatus Bathyarchaeota archaeon]|nr:nitroreductase family protein [Candidatus Bathyarchaeota archaeon]MBS7631168.1 nitroreductase family protein [Candidatus Bathyarchaeota archaeon]